MNLRDIWTEIEAVPFQTAMHDVFDVLHRNPAWPFLPVVDERRRVLGVVREHDLKGYAFAPFGRDLIKRVPLANFLKPTLVVSTNIEARELLRLSADNANPDGIAVTEDGVYRAVLLMPALLRLFEKQHVEAEVRLVQAQKMEAIGTLAGGIAHDLNNILTPILGYTELIGMMRQNGDPVDQELLDQIAVSARRAREIVKQILAFSRHQKSERGPMSLGRAVKDTLPLIRSSVPATIDIEMRVAAAGDLVMANPDEIHRVVVNLCTNAYHAMRDRGGRMTIALDRHTGPVLGWSLQQELPLGDFLRLSVSDTGTGIAPAVLPRIFEPFFTTKQQGDGTGLGLPIVHGITSRYGGFLSVETAVGAGSTFHVHLPRLGAAVAARETDGLPAPAADAAARPVRVLFVDDEFAITRLAGKFLGKYGILAETENDSVCALNAFRKAPGTFDVLVTDQTMPGITGLDLAREVLRIRPRLPIILCTGYSDTVSPEQAKAAGVCEYVLKPPDFPQLAGLIRRWAEIGAPSA
jgi:signal transduction histidine kinase